MSNLITKIHDRFKYQVFHKDDLQKEKIFVIGMSKTGTTSITNALEVLGFRSIHFAPVGKLSRGKLTFDWSWWLNKYDAFSDIPVTHFCVELDRKFPHKKFIQTVRDKNSWLESAKKHFAFPSQHDYVRAIHEQIYGTDVFDRQLFSEAYDRHQSEIDRYFTGRSDFLKIDICDGEGWEKLCPFLEKDIPNIEFPRSNQNPTVVLTPLGLECFREAIQTAEQQTQESQLCLEKDLNQRADIDAQTLSDILQCDIQFDRHKLKFYFSRFGLDLKDEYCTKTLN